MRTTLTYFTAIATAISATFITSRPLNAAELTPSLSLEEEPQSNEESEETEWLNMPAIYPGYKPISEESKAFRPAAPSFSGQGAMTSDSDASQYLPEEFRRRAGVNSIRAKAAYNNMIAHPGQIRHLAWLLPDPPELFENRQNAENELLYGIPMSFYDAEPTEMISDIRRTNWLHTFNSGVQFSQAYLSPNWYQGGNNSLTLLINFLWTVKLNDVYHPNLLLDNTVSYKLGLYSTPQDEYHDYSVSEDLFQWNFKFGVKAFNKWFYSFTSQFKTQLLNTYGENSTTRKSSFLSPGTLTLGLGMTYSTTNKSKSLKFNASISPLSYNLNTCIDKLVDPVQYNISAGRKTSSEYGSNAELTMEWAMSSNISYRSRLFAFTNYKYFLSDWENTFNFTINRFLSTQIYVHLRYDSSTTVTDITATKRWRYWMLKEILSFGFAYTFSTK